MKNMGALSACGIRRTEIGRTELESLRVVQCQKALVNALVERLHPDTHTFHLLVGECAVTPEDVAVILGLSTDGLSVTEMTMSSFEALEAKCLQQFRVAPRNSDCRASCIKLTWLRDLKERLQLVDETSMQKYVKCHIMLLFGTLLFGDKSGASVYWKFLPLLRDFGSIGQYNWISAYLAHLYRNNHVLTELLVPPQHPLDIYMYWYRARYDNHLNLSDRVDQENDEGNQVMDDDNEEQEPQSPPPPPPPTQEQPQSSNPYLLGFMAAKAGQSEYGHQPDFMDGRYSLDAMHPYRTSSVTFGGLVSGDSSRSDGGREILNSQNPRHVSMGLIEENTRTTELETDEYLVDTLDDEDDE
ncbi:hypothetical protein Ahy_A09g046205 [Arachis hypogaea]|uniref:Aminotransferase-like plant mobile domain-containing protein n=1 Tax=Arachis hypogaea TaxID=3818 RepID=A0A445BP82_ARAHY|nr:hypothetical protein Ahy_A09g046205 [Arachis hypogaea]